MLLGVKDYENIIGFSYTEEYYMMEAAAQLYCQPPVTFDTLEWKSEGKIVLESKIPKSTYRPHKAPTKKSKYMVFIRVKDQNILANKILLEYWKDLKKQTNRLLKINAPERFLFKTLKY